MMKHNYLYKFGLAVALLVLQGCEYEFQDPNAVQPASVDPQNLDLDSYVAFGGSFTAGFMDNALYSEGQRSAYPMLIAEAFRAVEPDLEFNFPDVNDEIGYDTTIVVNQTQTYHLGRLKFDEPGNVASIKGSAFDFIFDPGFDPGREGCPHVPRALFSQSPTRPQDYFAPYSGPQIHNYALPNVSLVQQFNPGLGDPLDRNFNQYYNRIKNDQFPTVISDALNVDFTFFTMWFGLTEITSYALDGGEGFLTSSADFRVRLRAVLGDVLRSKSAAGMIATVPDILDFPFFTSTTQSSGVMDPFQLTAQKAQELNEAYWLQGYPRVEYFKAGLNHYLIETKTGALRQFDPANEYVTVDFAFVQDQLGTGERIACDNQTTEGIGLGIIHENELVEVEPGLSVPKAFPIPGNLVLDASEVRDMTQRIDQFNTEIRDALLTVIADPNDPSVAAITRVGLVDMHRAFKDFRRDGAIFDDNGFAIMYFDDGIAGVFSTDGLHPTPKGQAWIANHFIEAMNNRFNTNFEAVDLLQVRGNDYSFTP